MKILSVVVLALWALLPTISNAQQGNGSLCFTTNGDNCVPGLQASNSVAIAISAATTTRLVAAVTDKAIFVTSWDIMAANTNNITLVYGTGTNCATGSVSLTGSYPLIAQAGISKGNGVGAILFIPKNNALCITTSASTLVAGSVSYVQF